MGSQIPTSPFDWHWSSPAHANVDEPQPTSDAATAISASARTTTAVSLAVLYVASVDTEYWNGEAGRAWAEGAPMMDRILRPFAETLLEAASIPSEGTIIDVGCGCGATTLLVTERHPGVNALGVDVSRPMLAVARERSNARARLRFVELDASTGRPDPADAERIVSRFGLMFFPDPTAAFANMRGWLRPGGTLTGLVWNRLADNPWLDDLVGIVSRHTAQVWEPGDGPGPFSLSDPRATRTMLEAAGWTAVEQRDLDLPMRIDGTEADVLRFCLHRGPVATALAEATEAARRAVEDDVRAWVRARHDGEGATLPASARRIHAVAP